MMTQNNEDLKKIAFADLAGIKEHLIFNGFEHSKRQDYFNSESKSIIFLPNGMYIVRTNTGVARVYKR